MVLKIEVNAYVDLSVVGDIASLKHIIEGVTKLHHLVEAQILTA